MRKRMNKKGFIYPMMILIVLFIVGFILLKDIPCLEDCEREIGIRPLVSGIQIEHERISSIATCTLGMIVYKNDQKFILTAGHCITIGPDGMPDYPDDMGLWVKQGGEIVGYVSYFDNSGAIDAALISINSNIASTAYTDTLGNTISGFTNPVEGMSVYKIGTTTGLTYGTITNTNIFYRDKSGSIIRVFSVIGSSGTFSTFGDSGSAIVTTNTPHMIVGILSAGSGSNWGMDIKNTLGID